jgi:hypothetical protein
VRGFPQRLKPKLTSVYGTIEIVPFQNTAMKLQETLGSKQEKARLGAGLLISGFLTAACGSSTIA